MDNGNDERRGKVGNGVYVMANKEFEIKNKVAQSGLINISLEEYYPKGKRALVDLKDFLFEGLILREKYFREKLKLLPMEKYSDTFVAIHCSADAIIPTWAYMLIAVSIEPYAKKVVYGNLIILEQIIFREALQKIELEKYRDQKIIINGCSNHPVPESAFVEITTLLRPVAKSIMFGEACSTVPLYKRF